MDAKVCFLVDDDLDDQEIFMLALQELDPSIDLVTANNGREALDQLSEGLSPDYIFLDLNMPLVDGKQCLKEIKKNSNWQHIPVIMYSTSADINDINDTRNLGASAFITKPTTIDALVSALGQVLNYRMPLKGPHNLTKSTKYDTDC